MSRGQRNGSLFSRPGAATFFIQVAPQLTSRGWVDPVPDPLLLRKSGSAGDRTRDLYICSQKLWPLDHRGGPYMIPSQLNLKNQISTAFFCHAGWQLVLSVSLCTLFIAERAFRIYGKHFHYDVSSQEDSLQPQCCCCWFCAEFQVLSKYTTYRRSCGCNTAVTVQQPKDVGTKKTLQRLPTLKAAKCASSKSCRSQFCWRKTDPWDVSSWRGSIHVLWDATAVSVREWFPTFRRIVVPSSSKVSSPNHPKRRRHIPTTSNLALLNSVVILHSFAFLDPCIHLWN